MTDVISDVVWYEKYRPTSLAELALAPDTRKVFEAYLKAGEIPHLLLVGPAGSGKTTVARILYGALDAQVLVLNASNDRGIDMVREKVGGFVTSKLGTRWNIVFLDEADALTSDAQTALRNLIEAHADHSRFILTANYGYKIIGPIQSRCQVMVMDRPPLKERQRILAHVLKSEGIKAEPLDMLAYAERFPDMRQMLMSAQRAVLINAGKQLPPVSAASETTGADLWDAVRRKDWLALRGYAKTGDFQAIDMLRQLFYAIPDAHPNAGRLRQIVGRGVHETGFSPDPVILYLATVAEAMEAV